MSLKGRLRTSKDKKENTIGKRTLNSRTKAENSREKEREKGTKYDR